VHVESLCFILCFGRGPPLQAEVQGNKLYDGKLLTLVWGGNVIQEFCHFDFASPWEQMSRSDCFQSCLHGKDFNFHAKILENALEEFIW
jgi:hypothetical protein